MSGDEIAEKKEIALNPRGVIDWIYLPYLLISVTILTYILMILGSYTSAIGAGLSCPDWPTCYGSWIPFLTPEVIAESPYTGWQIFVEWAHRGIASIVGILILFSAGTTYLKRGRDLVTYSLALAVILLPLQILLGGLTVTRSLEPVIVTSHLATATLILIFLTTASVAAWIKHEPDKQR